MLLKLISCGSLALVSVLVVTLLQGLRQHNQRIHALQERIDQLEERTPNRAHSELLSQQMGVMQERMDAFSAMRTSAASSLHRIPAGIGQDEALQENARRQWLQYYMQTGQWSKASELVVSADERDDLEYLKVL